jgi:hypothetical protein
MTAGKPAAPTLRGPSLTVISTCHQPVLPGPNFLCQVRCPCRVNPIRQTAERATLPLRQHAVVC